MRRPSLLALRGRCNASPVLAGPAGVLSDIAPDLAKGAVVPNDPLVIISLPDESAWSAAESVDLAGDDGLV